MSKRPAVNLADLTSEAAAPMSEAAQRIAQPAAPVPAAVALAPVLARRAADAATRTENLEALAFKVPKAFRRRFKQRATNADLKLNQLLFEALEAWEEKRGLKS
ncbi:hypothetical protein [Acidisphaera sp. S103]|uniref:hypothetical protein n=1 Tax=Acidisphaera sp. S103 TaxID=1747223 RepID=UPI00131E3791|nr:hypothetical protein [Acidisphaera sp. S103]